MQLVFATNNQHKIEEIQSIIPRDIQITGLQAAGILVDIPEPHPTLEENAKHKVEFILNIKKMDCFSEDSGLFIEPLEGKPGVRSARFAGDKATNKENIELVLNLLKKKSNRAAFFKTIICLYWQQKFYFFEGICKGKITVQPIGNKGFGYDSIFIPDGSQKTFGEMSLAEKNLYSHREKATQQFIQFFQNCQT